MLFHHNKQRSSSVIAENEVHNICQLMEREAKRLLKRKDLHDEARGVLVSLQKHWHGLTLFLEHPSLPLDNNASERALRNPVVGRKNYYGSRSIWSGCLSSMLF
jgi:transposase